MPSPATTRNIYRIIPYALIWVFFSLVYTLLERGLLGAYTFYPSTGNPYNFTRNILITPVAALIGGLLMGTAEIVYFNRLFVQKSFSKKIIYKSVIFLAIILSFLVLTTVIANAAELRKSIFDDEVWDNLQAFFASYAFWGVVLYMAAIIVLSQFYAEVSESIGQGVLANFFTGKYHTPQEEERIYMFLDMKSSTSIAEQLGHIKYFEMLREYYADLSAPVIQYAGEIYQYVGDEMVVTWKMAKGLRDNNCIQCFFAMKTALQKQQGKYKERFGVTPVFKAGLHMGKVTTGEIGVIKKEIIFTGDVLNTTSRIQGLCTTYNVDILISGELEKRLVPDLHIQTKPLGEKELKGKDIKIELFTVYQS